VRNIEYRLSDDFELIFPNVGDAELRTISFNSPDIHIGLWLPMRNVELLITMHKSSLLSVWSAVPQNVIDRLFVFPNLANAKLPKNSATKDALEKALEKQDEMILTIEPIVGSRLICSAQRVTFSSASDL
jgi:hypothetical protein